MVGEEAIARLLLKQGAVSLNVGEPFTYASGIRSPIYCDNRLLISDHDAREQVIEGFLNLIAENGLEFDAVTGVATSGIPWAAWIASRLKKPMVYVRSKAKGHGKQSAIEGNLPKGTSVIVIEDLISTGGSSHAAIDTLRDAGAKVIACLAIFTYELSAAAELFADCPLYTLSNFSALIAESGNTLAEDEQKKRLNGTRIRPRGQRRWGWIDGERAALCGSRFRQRTGTLQDLIRHPKQSFRGTFCALWHFVANLL